jgi:hypothetical protein
MLLYFCFAILLSVSVIFCDIIFHIFPHLLALSMCNMYDVLFNCIFVKYSVFISLYLFLVFVFVVVFILLLLRHFLFLY